MPSVIEFIKNQNLKNRNIMKFIGKTNYSEINEAERKLAMKFGKQFRKIIYEFGCISFNSIEIFGLGVKYTSHMNVVNVTKDLQKYNLPQGYIPFYNIGDGHYAVVDGNDKVYEFVINEKKLNVLDNNINNYLLKLFNESV